MELILKRVWQCGHCGKVHNDLEEAESCCGGYEELSFKDENTGKLYSDDAVKKYLCKDCKGYGYVSGGVDISGESTSFKCLKCQGTGIERCQDGN